MGSGSSDSTGLDPSSWSPESVKAAVSEKLDAVTGSVSALLDQSLAAASDTVRSSTAAVSTEANKAAAQAKGLVTEAEALARQGENVALGYLREGAAYIQAHRDESIAAGVLAAAVLLPGPRRFLYRHTLGRFRSEEAVVKSAEIRSATVRDRVEAQNRDMQKLQERLALAQAEYSRGLSKLQATASELQSLESRVSGAESTAQLLLEDLRRMPSKQAIALRSEVAKQLSGAKSQRKAVERMIKSLAKQGI